MSGPDLLRLRNLTLWRETPQGRQPLLSGLDLDLRPGEWVGLLGRNGAGKTSLLRYLAEEGSPLRGRSCLVGQDPEDQLVARSVREELLLGRPAEAAALLPAYGLEAAAALDPRLLSAGQKQRLVLAVAEAARPEVLLCDEPTALQDAAQARWVRERLLRWRREGLALVLATARPEEARLCDRLLVLAGGRVADQGPAAEVLGRPAAAALLGLSEEQEAAPPAPRSAPPDAAPVAAWRGVGMRFPTGGGFAGVDLEIRPGERIGLTGPNGCGKSTLLALAAGLRASERGSCWLGGRRLCPRGRPDLDHGLAILAPQFPEHLFTRPHVRAEIDLDPRLRPRRDEVLAAAGLAAADLERGPHELSAGQRRRLALALALLSGRPLVLLDEPSAAVDRQGRREVVRLVRGLPPATAAVIASHDAALLAACGCRVLELGPAGLAPGLAAPAAMA